MPSYIREAVLVHWLRSLAGMIEAGVPLGHALHVLAGARATRDLSAAAVQRVFRGEPLSVALGGRTPPVVCAMVRAGEVSGQLPGALRQAADFLEARHQAQQMLRRELGMPAATAIYTSAILLFALGVVVPRFSAVYERMGIVPPPLTQAVIDVSRQLAEGWPLLLIAAGLTAAAVLGLFRRLDVVRRSHLAAFSWALGALLHSRVPIVHALELAGSASGTSAIARSAALAAREVDRGADLVPAMRRHGLVPGDLLVLLSGGATSGRMPEALESISRLLRQQVEQTVGRLARWLGGGAVLAVGAAVLVLALSVYVPVVQLALSAMGRALGPGP